MEASGVKNWQKIAFISTGVLVCIVAIIMSIVTSYRTAANELSTGVLPPEESNMRIDIKAENGVVETQSVTTSTESNTAASSDNQQTGTTETSPNVEIKVDGTPIDIPQDGSVHKVIQTEDGSARIDFSSRSNSFSGDTRSRSSINVDIDSSVRIRD